MNFWATRLTSGGTTGPPVKAISVPAQVQGAWFSNPTLLGPQQAPEEPSPGEEQPLVTNAKSPRILASRHSGCCPSCGGENYGRAGSANTYERCFECGYNSRFEQAMAGAGATGGAEGPATPAQQVASGGGSGSINNFHPSMGKY